MSMHKKVTTLVFIILFSVKAVFSIEINITSEELEEFKVTLYTGFEQIPFEDFFTLDGDEYDKSALKGRYVLLNLGASWCPFCIKEKSSLQWLYNNYSDDRFTVLTVYVNEQINEVKQFIEENAIELPTAVQPNNKLRQTHAQRVPTSYLINSDGYIVARINLNKEWDSPLALKVLEYLRKF